MNCCTSEQVDTKEHGTKEHHGKKLEVHCPRKKVTLSERTGLCKKKLPEQLAEGRCGRQRRKEKQKVDRETTE